MSRPYILADWRQAIFDGDEARRLEIERASRPTEPGHFMVYHVDRGWEQITAVRLECGGKKGCGCEDCVDLPLRVFVYDLETYAYLSGFWEPYDPNPPEPIDIEQYRVSS